MTIALILFWAFIALYAFMTVKATLEVGSLSSGKTRTIAAIVVWAIRLPITILLVVIALFVGANL